MLTNTAPDTAKNYNSDSIPPLPQQERRALARLAGSKWYGKPVKRGGSLIAINTEGDRQPFFGVGLYKLGNLLGPDQPFYIFQMCGVRPSDYSSFIKSMAAHFIDEIKSVQPEGPYLIGGHCFSGWIVYEMAQQLQQQGDKVDLMVLVERGGKSKTYDFFKPFLKSFSRNWYEFCHLSYDERKAYVTDKIKHKLSRYTGTKEQAPYAALNDAGVIRKNSADFIQEGWRREQRQASVHYDPQPYSGTTALYYARWGGRLFFFCPKGGMGGLLTGQMDVHEYAGYHNSLATEPENVRLLAEDITARLKVAQQESEYTASCLVSEQGQNIGVGKT